MTDHPDHSEQLQAVPLTKIRLDSGFWAARQATNHTQTIPAVTRQLELTGRLDAWRLDWQPGQPPPHVFWDSDVGKWIEAVGYSLATTPTPDLEARVDAVVELMAKAQQPDGYLNTHFIAVEPEKRWHNLRDRHELYCAGHLIEGAVAFAQATGKRKMLDVVSRYADHIARTFGTEEGQNRGYCGHAEIELALVKLYQATGEMRYLKLAQYFIEERGQSPNYFDIEARERGEDPRNYWAKTYRYCQSHVPVREQTTATGHSVRACYLYAGIADIALQTQDQTLHQTVRSIWDDLTQHQMYITGGLGPAHTNEGFTFAYDLPNEEAYAETCASIALVLWAQRMFELDQDGRYTDVIERALYNGILSGVSYDGSTFFYANPLASYPQINPFGGSVTDGYYRRSEWFDCACCPPNLARLLANIGSYFYSTIGSSVYVHLYNQSTAQLEQAGRTLIIEQQTNYPWDGEITLSIQVEQPTPFDLALRIPEWCHDFSLEVNGQALAEPIQRGYVHVMRTWSAGDQARLRLAMPVERMAAHPAVRQDAGYIALQRGPVLYCLEETDNGAQLANVVLPHDSHLSVDFDAALFGGISVLTGQAIRIVPKEWHNGLYQSQSALAYERQPLKLKAIPYCFWANREPGEMRVWIREA